MMVTWCFLVLASLIGLVRGNTMSCGIPAIAFDDRIVGGENAAFGEFPWMVKITNVNHLVYCGGSLIADRYVLTAGHCVTEHIDGASLQPAAFRGYSVNYVIANPSDVFVEIRAFLLSFDGIPVQARNIILHPMFDEFESEGITLYANDIALIKTDPIEFSPTVIPICLPYPGNDFPPGTDVRVAGWGTTKTEAMFGNRSTELSEVLKKSTLFLVYHKECTKNPNVGMHFREGNGMDADNTICLLGHDTGNCRGDSGGPAFVQTPAGAVIIGVVSWGIGCNQPNSPAVYARVINFMDFIIDNTRDGIFLPGIKPW